MSKRRNSERVYAARDAAVALSQEIAIARLFGCVRVVFNDACNARREAHQAGQKYPSNADLQKRLITQAKLTDERAWLGGVSPVPLQQAVADNGTAYKNFFDSLSGKRKGRKMGLPRFKRKNGRQSARFTRNARFKVRKGNTNHYLLALPGIPGELRIKCSRPIPDDPSSVTLIREPDGTLHASFCHEVDQAVLDAQIKPPVDSVLGIDVGLESLTANARLTYDQAGDVTEVSRDKTPNPRHLRNAQKKLTKAQKELSRKTKGSCNRNKARVKVARLHSKVARTRMHLYRQLARQWLSENQAVAVEGLSILGLCRAGAHNAAGRGLRKSVHDASWGTLLAQLHYYADLWGRDIIPIDRFAPTSQTCSVCGTCDGAKPLDVRVWECGHCHTVLDRDWNACMNILLSAGLADTACGEDVRLAVGQADLGEAGTRWSRETPSPVAA